jgi:hypothetical protein
VILTVERASLLVVVTAAMAEAAREALTTKTFIPKSFLDGKEKSRAFGHGILCFL